MECETGQYAEKYASTHCLNCPAGKYGTESAQSYLCDCKRCDPGAYSDVEGANTCKLCAVGKYQPNVGAANDCMACQNGSDTRNQTGETACRLVDKGKIMGLPELPESFDGSEFSYNIRLDPAMAPMEIIVSIL